MDIHLSVTSLNKICVLYRSHCSWTLLTSSIALCTCFTEPVGVFAIRKASWTNNGDDCFEPVLVDSPDRLEKLVAIHGTDNRGIGYQLF